MINVKDSYFGAVGDGVADDTIAIHRAFDHAKSISSEVHFPPGVYRVTAGYTQSVSRKNLFLKGSGRINELGDSKGSLILLDGPFFIDVAASSTLRCEGLMFKCAQFVQDRDFFRFSAGLTAHHFKNCGFDAVERPIVYKTGVYFQNASFRDVQFANSGTFHSETSALVGTYLRLDNVTHEGSVPENTEKTVCNLQGIRYINADSFLMEGALPSADWTVLKLNNAYDAQYTRAPVGSFTWFHSEWSGAFPPAYAVDQVGGAAVFSEVAGLNATSKYKLSGLGKATIANTSFSETAEDPATFFELENGQCVVQFQDCAMRGIGGLGSGFQHANTQFASITNGQGQVVLSNDAAQEVYRWDGGLVSPGLFGGTTCKVSTDATHGRKIVFTPNAGALSAELVKANHGLLAGDQVTLACKAKLPDFTTGQWAFLLTLNGVGTAYKYFDTSHAGTVVDVLLPWVLLSTPTTIAMGFSNGTSTGATTDLEVYAAVLYHGNSIPRRQVPSYPRNVVSWALEPPKTGVHAVGDVVHNSAPSVGASMSWRCTAAPCTWVSDGL